MNKLFLSSFFTLFTLTLCSCGAKSPEINPNKPEPDVPVEPDKPAEPEKPDPEKPTDPVDPEPDKPEPDKPTDPIDPEPEKPEDKYEVLTLDVVKDMPFVFNNNWKNNTYEKPKKLYTQYEKIEKRNDGTTEVIVSKETYKVAYDLESLKAYMFIKMESTDGVLLNAVGNQYYDGTNLINIVNGKSTQIACSKEEATAFIVDDTPYQYAFGYSTATMYEDTVNLPNEVALYNEQVTKNKNESATKENKQDYRYYEESDKLSIYLSLLGLDFKIALTDGSETILNKYNLDISQTYEKGICSNYSYVYDVIETFEGKKMGQTITKTLTSTSDFDIETLGENK